MGDQITLPALQGLQLLINPSLLHLKHGCQKHRVTYICISDQSRLLGALVALAQSTPLLKCHCSECKYQHIIIYRKIFIKLRALVGLSEVYLIFENFSGPRLQFVMGQIRAALRSPRGYRWTNYDKAWPLCLLHSSPRAYRLLKRMFALLSLRTLRKVMEKVEIYPRFIQPILKALQYKTEKLPNKEKNSLSCHG